MLEYFELVLDSLGTVWAACGVIYAINYDLVCMRSEMAIGFRFHKVEPMFGEWDAHGYPTARLGTVKNSPDLHWLDQNVHVLMA